MSGLRVTSMRGMACALVVATLVMVASFAMVAATPASAHAEGKTSVWVVKSVKSTYDGGSSVSNYTYSNKGLVKSLKEVYKYDSDSQTFVDAYAYTSKNAYKGQTVKMDGKTVAKYTFTNDSKGRVTKSSYKVDGKKYVTKYAYNKKGQVSKATFDDGNYTKFSYSGGLMTKTVSKGEYGSYTTTYKYDKKGYPTKVYYDGGLTASYKNTYKNGKLVKRSVKDESGKVYSKITYTYKKVSVPKSLAKMVKAQQRIAITQELPLVTAHK